MADAHQLISVCLNPAVDRSIEVDGLVLGEHQTGREVSRVAGGKAVNVTRVLAALDVACLATGFVGESNRLIFDSHLAQPLITEDFVSLPGWTRENITLIDTVAGQETHIRDAGLAITSEAMFALSGKLRSMVTDSSTVVFSGSLPPGVSPAAHASLIDLCIQTGAKVAVDTSGAALAELADRPLWLVKPNAEELAQLVGRPLAGLDDQLAAIGQLTETMDQVLLSRGADGAYLADRTGIYHGSIEVDPASIVNTVGCGDALLGAFIACLHKASEPAEALKVAVAVATAAAMTPASAQFDPGQAALLADRVTIGPAGPA